MNEGKIILDGTPEEVFRKKEILRNSRLDILETMKLIERIEADNSFRYKDKLEGLLWELTFKK